MESFSNGPLIVLCLLIAGSAKNYFPLGDITAQGRRKPHNRALIVKDENNGLLGRPKVCADLGSTEPTGSPFITLVPASTMHPRPHISDPSTFCNDKPDGNYAYPTNPHKYYRCSNGQTVVMNCPGSFVYSAIKDWPSDLIVDEFCKDRPNGNYSYQPDPHNSGAQPLWLCRPVRMGKGNGFA
ncbi:hypothetical protein L345_09481 [Ophiophagus hannah]|uniref:chitinase n=1 Tax=Ophiophagus hannah TaxID=8665 RepID=V8NR45_OPHHA|nr:hypothetical protein L345_09481 [Ophiophagus hannah]